MPNVNFRNAVDEETFVEICQGSAESCAGPAALHVARHAYYCRARCLYRVTKDGKRPGIEFDGVSWVSKTLIGASQAIDFGLLNPLSRGVNGKAL